MWYNTDNFSISPVQWNDINIWWLSLSWPTSGKPWEANFRDSAWADTWITTLWFALNEQADWSFELMHDYKEWTDLYFHVHFQWITAPWWWTDNVKFQLTYTLSRNWNTLSPVTIISKEVAFTTQYAFARLDFDAITWTNFKIWDQFLFDLKRIVASSDDYAWEWLVATIWVHYQINSLWSRLIGTK